MIGTYVKGEKQTMLNVLCLKVDNSKNLVSRSHNWHHILSTKRHTPQIILNIAFLVYTAVTVSVTGPALS